MLDLKGINIVVLANPFNLREKEIYSSSYVENKSIAEYVKPYTLGITDLTIAINGHTLTEEESKLVPSPGDCIAVCETIKGVVS